MASWHNHVATHLHTGTRHTFCPEKYIVNRVMQLRHAWYISCRTALSQETNTFSPKQCIVNLLYAATGHPYVLRQPQFQPTAYNHKARSLYLERVCRCTCFINPLYTDLLMSTFSSTSQQDYLGGKGIPWTYPKHSQCSACLGALFYSLTLPYHLIL